MDDKIKELKKIIDESSNIVFFGGAGVSIEETGDGSLSHSPVVS